MANEVISKVEEYTLGVMKDLFGSGDLSGQNVLFAKWALFLLFFILAWIALTRLPMLKKQKGVAVIVSLVVAIYASYFISDTQLFYGVIVPLKSVSLVWLSLGSFLIFFFLAHAMKTSALMRKGLWAVYAISFVYMIYSRELEWTNLNIGFVVGTLVLVALAYTYDSQLHEKFRKKAMENMFKAE